MNEETGAASNVVSEAVDRGVNYFEVAPSCGNAQERLAPALVVLIREVGLQLLGSSIGRNR
jgi:aryl-alcohol dehydrogenase-like predicted oxidoreductase